MVLPDMPDAHLCNIMSEIGVEVYRIRGSPSSLLSVIRLNEVAQATLAKAKEAALAKSKASYKGRCFRRCLEK